MYVFKIPLVIPRQQKNVVSILYEQLILNDEIEWILHAS